MGEVDQLENAVHERVAQRDQRVDRPVRDPDQQHLDEPRRPLGEVDPEPDEKQRDEEQAQRADHRDGREPPAERLSGGVCCHGSGDSNRLRGKVLSRARACRGVTIEPSAEVAELADAPDSKSGSLRGVWVRPPPSALTLARRAD